MRKLLCFLICCLFISFSNLLSAQSRANLSQIATVKNGTDWVKFKPDIKIKSSDVFLSYYSFFGMRNNIDKMKLIKTETDKLNYSHYKFQQYYNDIPVEGAQYILHEYKGYTQTGNGKLIIGLNLNIKPSLSSKNAVDKALAFVNAEKYKWQDADAEIFLKNARNNPSETYYPKPELVIADNDYSNDPSKYILVYKMEVYATKPLQRLDIFVDATTGEIYHSINILINSDIKTKVLTHYDGLQNITVDSISADSFRLREEGRGKGIITYSMNNGMNYSLATGISSASKYFSSDKVANEAHWGAEKTYDYYLNKFGRNSYDNAGAPLISNVHYGYKYLNAFWDGTQMTYGDGGYDYGPFVSLDVCAHEITHAVSGITAKFIYQNESGALSESFSDIFATAVEFYSVSTPNWNIGEDINAAPFRSLSNPKTYQQPTTYHGQYWDYGKEDNGGVHQNCSVGNYWFYLLSQGKSGKNDNGYYYNVTGIGMESAERIAYRTMTCYLTANSKYIDAYFASLQAAADLFGNCSPEVKQTALAWYAAGVGYPVANNEVYLTNILSPASGCGLTKVNIGINMYYAGCDSILRPGLKVVLAYKMDTDAKVYDTLTLSKNWFGGDSLKFTFKLPADISKVGNHKLSCWIKLGENPIAFNDSIINYQFTNILHQNIDVGAVKGLSPVTGCGLSSQEPVSVKFTFYGCDSIPKGDTIALSYKINSDIPVIENYILTKTMYPRNILSYTFSTLADLSNIQGTIKIQARTLYKKDTFNLNDAINFSIKNPVSLAEKTITFDETNVNDLFYITTTYYSHASVSAIARNTGKYGFLMTGGNVKNFYHNLRFPDGTNTWQTNDFLSAKISFCIDASLWSHVNMKFDIKQTNGGAAYSLYLGPGDYTKASNMRILANNTQIGGTYNPLTENKDPWRTEFVNLDSYAGSRFTLTFESRCISKDTTMEGFPLKMDNVYIDNISFSEQSQIGINDIEINKFYAALYPTLSNDSYTIDMQSDAYQNTRFETFDLFGKLIKAENQKVYKGKNKFVFNSSELNKGIYLIRLTGKSNTLILRMIKQ